jgi:predicted transcriptional regulator
MDNNNRTFKLLNLLYSKQGEYIKSKEILEKLNLKSHRNIHHMIAKLKALGYNVQSMAGYNGGYRIVDNDILFENEINHIKALLERDDLLNTFPNNQNTIIFKKILNLNKKVKFK